MLKIFFLKAHILKGTLSTASEMTHFFELQKMMFYKVVQDKILSNFSSPGVFENSLIPLSDGAIVRDRRVFSRAKNDHVKHIKSVLLKRGNLKLLTK